MNKELILKSDVLDIIFENRNKSYGAYNLRKFYVHRLAKAIGIMFAAVAVSSAFAFLPEKKELISARPYEIPDPVLSKPKEKEPEKKKTPPKEQVKQNPVNSKKWVADLRIVKNTDRPDSLRAIEPDDAIGKLTIAVPGGRGPTYFPTAITNGPTGEKPTPVKDPADILTPRDNADVMPSYPGGMAALLRFLEKNLQSPKDMETGETVDVKIKFVVGYDGKLERFVTIKDGGEEFNNEVIRVLKRMPQWIPGKANGENVSVYFTLPVKFVPSD